MAELRERVGVNTQRRALTEALNRIRERGQQLFTDPLAVEYYEFDTEIWIPGEHPFFYIAEVRTKYRLFGIIRRKQYRHLFAIYPEFYGGAYGKKESNCTVFDRSLLEIVREEVQKYADAFRATAINLTQDFAH